ncbi:hypothetical protein C8J56DRAFT_27932 [Mycena floridula]|nr:hypothetical protein C8J56DRAFT_27932 [Mycena floridula]
MEKLDETPQVQIPSSTSEPKGVWEMFTPTTLVTLLVLCFGVWPTYYAFDCVYDPAMILYTVVGPLSSASIVSTTVAAIAQNQTSTVTKSFYVCMTCSFIALTTTMSFMYQTNSVPDPSHSWKDLAAMSIRAFSTVNFVALLWYSVGRRNGTLMSNSSCIVLGLWWLVLLGLSLLWDTIEGFI